MSEIPAERLVFLDESGVTTKMARTHARAPRGQRAYGSIPLGSWRRLTVLGALASEGLVATMSLEAATSTRCCWPISNRCWHQSSSGGSRMPFW
jgi:hypothetical protein